jgi:hypothetical protein
VMISVASSLLHFGELANSRIWSSVRHTVTSSSTLLYNIFFYRRQSRSCSAILSWHREPHGLGPCRLPRVLQFGAWCSASHRASPARKVPGICSSHHRCVTPVRNLCLRHLTDHGRRLVGRCNRVHRCLVHQVEISVCGRSVVHLWCVITGKKKGSSFLWVECRPATHGRHSVCRPSRGSCGTGEYLSM